MDFMIATAFLWGQVYHTGPVSLAADILSLEVLLVGREQQGGVHQVFGFSDILYHHFGNILIPVPDAFPVGIENIGRERHSVFSFRV